MPSTQHVRQLVSDIVPLLDLQQITYRKDRDACLLTFDADTMFDIEYDQTQGRIVIAGGIWEAAEHVRLRIYEILLQYNYLWTETGGIRMALDGLPGQVVMLFEMSTADLSTQRLCSALENLVDIQRAWRQMLQAIDGGEPANLVNDLVMHA